jgi:hypothetical protein
LKYFDIIIFIKRVRHGDDLSTISLEIFLEKRDAGSPGKLQVYVTTALLQNGFVIDNQKDSSPDGSE